MTTKLQGALRIDGCNCFPVLKTARRMTRAYDAHLAPTGLRITQFLILAVLNEVGSAVINELAERLDTERTAMGKMIATLERDGLLASEPSPSDARSRVIRLTAKGSRLLAQAEPLWEAAQREFTKLNGAETAKSLKRTLAKLEYNGELS